MKVLIVEDDTNLRELWLEVFQLAGHQAVTASNAEHAREVLLIRAFDVVVLDLCLGNDSGLSVATLATYSNPRCRVVMITGSTLFARGELFSMTPNIAAVLRKPVSIHELVAVAEHEGRDQKGAGVGAKRNGDAREEVDAAVLHNDRP